MFAAVVKVLLLWLGRPALVGMMVSSWVQSLGTDQGVSFVVGVITFVTVLGIMSVVNTVFDLFSGGSSTTNYNDYSQHGPTHNHYTSHLYDQRSVHFHEDSDQIGKLKK